MAVAMTASMSMGQNATAPLKVQTVRTAAPRIASLAKASGMPYKSAATGNYYTRPAGSMYVGIDKSGRGYSAALLNMTPFEQGVFVNKNADPSATTWSLETNVGTKDLSKYADENNNLVYSINPISKEQMAQGYYYYAPVLTNGNDQYKLDGLCGNDMGPLSFTSGSVGESLPGISSINKTNHYLYGSGISDTGDGVEYVNTGFSQKFEKPMTPLYVEDVHALVLSGNGHTSPLFDGGKLTMTITGEDNKVIATMEATAGDVTPAVDDNNKQLAYDFSKYGYGEWYCSNIVFAVKDESTSDAKTVPFVIDQPFTVTVTGFDNDGVDIGFYGNLCAPEDNIQPAYNLCYKKEGSKDDIKTYALTFKDAPTRNMAVELSFTALMDNVVVDTTGELPGGTQLTGCNIMRIGNDGTTNTFENYPDMEGASIGIKTVTPWKDENGNDQYYLDIVRASDNSGEWIKEMTVDDGFRINTFLGNTVTGISLLTFSADPITEGGRWAIGYIHGRGVVSKAPVIVLQGTATLDDVTTGIGQVVSGKNKYKAADAPCYNLNGQRVDRNYKGLVIQNGRKFMK